MSPVPKAVLMAREGPYAPAEEPNLGRPAEPAHPEDASPAPTVLDTPPSPSSPGNGARPIASPPAPRNAE
eukprot:6387579-Alexandrium_andersonii.AAC.1